MANRSPIEDDVVSLAFKAKKSEICFNITLNFCSASAGEKMITKNIESAIKKNKKILSFSVQRNFIRAK